MSEETPEETATPYMFIFCWSFNGPEPGDPESTMRRERRKEANIPWVTQLAFAFQGISQK